MGRAGTDGTEVMVEPQGKTALIIVDVQHDFLPGGALGVAKGDQVIPALEAAAKRADLVVATRDWHPADHMSFKENGGIWPAHCVQGTEGAEIHPRIKAIADRTISKGENPAVEQYSGIQGTHLADMLRAEGYTKLLIGGLATDYCVKATVLDALKEGFAVEVLADGSRAVNVSEGDETAAYVEMATAGATISR